MATINVQPGVRQTFGTSENDVITGTNQGEEILGLDGNDSIVGRDGNDTLSGNIGNDTISGDAGDDLLYGGQGSDLIIGGVGNDGVFGNKGDDYLFGAEGDDTIRGGQGDDQVFGGVGNDVLYGDLGNDSLTGESGRDVFVVSPGKGADIITDFTKGEDLIGLEGINFPDVRIVQDGRNNVATILSGAGETLATLQNFNSVLDSSDFTSLLASAIPFAPSDTPDPILPGATGNLGIVIDRLQNNSPYFADGRSTFTRNLSDPREATIENFQAGNDVLQLGDTGPFTPTLFRLTSAPNGSNFPGSLAGALKFNYNDSGQTTVTGVTSVPRPNQIKLGVVNPPSTPPTGAFTSAGTFTQTGSLIISSGQIDASGSLGGNDVIIVNGRNGSNVIAGPGNDSISGSSLANSSGDTIDGGSGNDTISGGTGNDSLSGSSGNDFLDGAQGDDILLGGTGNDTLFGRDGNDSLDGGTGDDSLSGGDGADTLKGGAGNNTLTGDAGKDSFVISGADGRVDTISDFSLADDIIILDPESGLQFSNISISAAGRTGLDTVISNGGRVIATLNGIISSDLSSINFTNSLAPIIPVPGSGEVSITTIDGVASELTFDTGVFEVTRTGSTAGDLVVEYAIAGTSTNGADYELLPGRVTIPAGQASAYISIIPIDDLTGEAIENVIVTLTRAPNFRISTTKSSATVSLTDDAVNVTIYPGTPADDRAVGTALNDRLNGAGGNDILAGGDGDDTLNGGTGNDDLRGDAGNDLLSGGTGADTLTGGDGADSFVFSSPADGVDVIRDFSPLGQLSPPLPAGQPAPVVANSGDLVVLDGAAFGLSSGGNIAPQQFQSANNIASIQAQTTARIIYLRDSGRMFYTPNGVPAGSLGTNTLFATFSPRTDIAGNQGAPDIKASDIQVSGNNTVDTSLPTVTIAPTDPVLSKANGDTGTFTVTRTGNLSAPLTVNFSIAPTTTPAIPIGGALTPITDAIFGADYILQPQTSITIPAGQASAVIQAFPISNGSANATPQRFTINLAAPSGYATVNASATGLIFATAINLSYFPGTDGNDRIVGTEVSFTNGINTGNDLIFGGAGNDIISGGTGDDTIDGGAGNDDIRGRNTSNQGLTVGISDNDLLYGGEGDDTINGDVGNDTLVGGPGRDVLTGGPFASALPQVDNAVISNRFLYNNFNEGPDFITDFISEGLVDRTPFVKAGKPAVPAVVAGNPPVVITPAIPAVDPILPGPEDNFVRDLIVLRASGFPGLSVSNSIAPSQFNNDLTVEPTARILYIPGAVGLNGLLYYTPTGIATANIIPSNAVLLAEFGADTGANSPFLAEAQIQVIP